MSFTVTATPGGASFGRGVDIKVFVLTNATESGGASSGNHNTAGGTAQGTLTPNFSGSFVGFGITADAITSMPAAATSNTYDYTPGGHTDTWVSAHGHYSGTVTASTSLTYGAGSAGAGDHENWCAYEVPASGGTITLDGSSPAGVFSDTGTSATSASFNPPPNSVLLVTVAAGGSGSGAGVTCSISDTSGLSLTWTQRATSSSSDNFQPTFVFTTTMPPPNGVYEVGAPATPARTTTSGSTLTGTWAASQTRTAGHTLVCCVAAEGTTSASAIPTPSGWTSRVSDTSQTKATTAIFTKTATGSDAAPSCAPTGSGTFAAEMVLYELGNADTTTPLDTSGSGGSTGNIGSASVTTSGNIAAANEFAIACLARERSAVTATITATSPFTLDANDGSTSSVGHIGTASYTTVAGDVGATKTATISFAGTTTSATASGVIAVFKQPSFTSTGSVALAPMALSGSDGSIQASGSLALAPLALPSAATTTMPYITGLGGSGYNSYFTDQFGRPRLMVIEQAWGLPWQAGRWNSGDWQADYTAYFKNRSLQGYTAWYGIAWGSTHVDSTALSGGRTNDGIYPLNVNGTPGAISTGSETITLNNSFWSRIDSFFNTAKLYGITCFLNMSMSYDVSATGAIWHNATNTQGTAFGNAIASRYTQASYPNVQWFFGDDDDGPNDSFYQAILNGIQAAGDTRPLISIEQFTNTNSHISFSSGAAFSGTFGAPNATYNWVYSYDAPYFGCEDSYIEGGSFHHIPPVYGDGVYYGDTGSGTTPDRAIRNFVWWGLSSGSRGLPSSSGPSDLGANTVWAWNYSGAQAAVSTDPNGSWTTSNVGAIASFFTSLVDWQKLIPDTGNVFITAGRGTRGTCDAAGGAFNFRNTNAYVAGSITPGGTLAVIYCKAAMSITIDQTKMGAGYTATWVDPANLATQSATPGSTYNSSGLGNNSAGDPDWVLVLQAPLPPIKPRHVKQAVKRAAFY